MYSKEPRKSPHLPLTTPEVEAFAPDLLCLRVSNGRFAPVNSWILGQAGQPKAIVDASFPEGLITRAYLDLQADGRLAEVSDLILTHFHRDHSGQFAALADHFGPRCHIPAGELAMMRQILTMPPEQVRAALDHFLCQLGLTSDEAKSWSPINYGDLILPKEEPDILHEGQTLEFGGREWRVLMGTGGGHSPEAASFLSLDGRYFLAGDQILGGGGPQVTLWSDAEVDPLGAYLAYLDRMAEVPDDCLVLPGHGTPFTQLSARVEEIRQGHLRRLDRMLTSAKAAPKTAIELIKDIYPPQADRLFGVVLFGMTMALATHLWQSGALWREVRPDGVLLFGA